MGAIMRDAMGEEAERRYNQDPEFRAVVDYMRYLARARAFTPYELKQAAYMAALLNELYSARKLRIPGYGEMLVPGDSDPDAWRDLMKKSEPEGG